mmetsp:Transcript_18334/g.40185  ORF Transcript_18334/g.40185 Transcript_18334/m.40185 type:complete len:204 (-) Transcript_18334:37-648(-)
MDDLHQAHRQHRHGRPSIGLHIARLADCCQGSHKGACRGIGAAALAHEASPHAAGTGLSVAGNRVAATAAWFAGDGTAIAAACFTDDRTAAAASGRAVARGAAAEGAGWRLCETGLQQEHLQPGARRVLQPGLQRLGHELLALLALAHAAHAAADCGHRRQPGPHKHGFALGLGLCDDWRCGKVHLHADRLWQAHVTAWGLLQ